VRPAIHRHPGKRRGGQTRWGTGLVEVAVGAVSIAGLVWAASAIPAAVIGASGHVGPGATLAITATRISGMRGIYPGGTGDVVVSIANRNDLAVRLTAVDLPSDTTYATGFTTRARTVVRAGCTAATSEVIWNGSARAGAIAAPLAVPMIIGAHHIVTVTMTNGAYMQRTAPSACEATYFAMPKLIGIRARTDGRARTSAPAIDTWVRRSP